MPATKLTSSEYLALVEQAPIMIWRAGPDARCDYFNQRWLDFTGRSLEQELGDGWAEGVHEDDCERCLKVYRDAFNRREAFELEYRLRRHDGAYRWIFDRGVPLIDDEGRFRGYVGSCVDVDERLSAQHEMQRLHDRAIKTLDGLMSICAWCKKVRTNEGDWVEIEDFITDRSDAQFSHGVCPDCGKAFGDESRP